MTVAVLVDQLERTSSTTARDLLKRAINGVLGTFEPVRQETRLVVGPWK